MRKINVLEFVSLDGVIQAPGGPKEDTRGGFEHGGWQSPHRDAVSGAATKKQMSVPAQSQPQACKHSHIKRRGVTK
jgi:hypothetical protein